MTLYAGFVQLGAGLSVGLAGLAAGFAIGIVGDAGVRGTAQQPRLYIGMVRLAGLPDSYSHFRRGAGSLWSDRCAHSEHAQPGRYWRAFKMLTSAR